MQAYAELKYKNPVTVSLQGRDSTPRYHPACSGKHLASGTGTMFRYPSPVTVALRRGLLSFNLLLTGVFQHRRLSAHTNRRLSAKPLKLTSPDHGIFFLGFTLMIPDNITLSIPPERNFCGNIYIFRHLLLIASLSCRPLTLPLFLLRRYFFGDFQLHSRERHPSQRLPGTVPGLTCLLTASRLAGEKIQQRK